MFVVNTNIKNNIKTNIPILKRKKKGSHSTEDNTSKNSLDSMKSQRNAKLKQTLAEVYFNCQTKT